MEHFWNSDVDIILPPSADECSLDRNDSLRLQQMWGQMADNFPLEEIVTEKIAEDNDWPSSRIHPYEAVSDRETSGMTGHAHKMGIKLSCIYEENIYVPAAEVRWFESASEAVFVPFDKNACRKCRIHRCRGGC